MKFYTTLFIALVAANNNNGRLTNVSAAVASDSVDGGAGSAVLEALQRMRLDSNVLLLGLPDRFVEHGDPASLIAECGLDAAGIAASIERYIS